MKFTRLIPLFIVLFLVGCTTPDEVRTSHGYIRTASQIVVLSGDQHGSRICSLYNGRYCWAYLYPGSHDFTGMFNYSGTYRGNGITTTVNLEPGKTYYFQVIQKPAYMIQNIVIKQTTKAANKFNALPPKPGMALVYFFYTLPISDLM